MEQYNQIEGRYTEPSQQSQYNMLRDIQINIPNKNTYQNQMRMNNFSLNNNIYHGDNNNLNYIPNPFARQNQNNNNIINQNHQNNNNNQNLNPFKMANPSTNDMNQIIPNNNQNYMNQFPIQNGFNNNNIYLNNRNNISPVSIPNNQDNTINNVNGINIINREINQNNPNFEIQNSLNPNTMNIQINQNNPDYVNINYNNNNIDDNINNNSNNNFNNDNFKYHIIQRGNKFSNNEINTIIKISYEELMQRSDPLSKTIIEKIKNIFKGEWVVFISANGLKGYDLSVSVDDENRLISFIIDYFRFQIIKISD